MVAESGRWSRRRTITVGLAVAAAVTLGSWAAVVASADDGPVPPPPATGYTARLAVGDVHVDAMATFRFAEDLEVTVVDVEPQFRQGADMVTYLGAYIAGSERNNAFDASGDHPWPPPESAFGPLIEVDGDPIVLQGAPTPYRDWNIVTGYRADQTGTFVLESVRVHYLAGGRRYHVDIRAFIYACVGADRPPPRGACDPPETLVNDLLDFPGTG